MDLNQDFCDLLQCLNADQVEYLVVGGYAVMYYSEPRFTKDLDIWINPEPANIQAMWRALAAFGAPLENVSPNDFTDPEMIYQIGIAPNRIDILTDVLGVEFAYAWQHRLIAKYGHIPMYIIGKEELIQSKLAAGRAQDLIDAKRLQQERDS